ncbi:YwiC-like family protein [Caviibacterium pharyngocola]|uniref:YwiC-like family protein n=1 Tax=Caviibacterium pharyngocola TaxID=28159 RepID=A0A2M8RTM9_9PAST|nr:YwiC-like family protein [Caviibacterium pharyngocola]PJG82246.1 hypothetical protein CVP04_10325 [Caviibacterium pharyngocola]
MKLLISNQHGAIVMALMPFLYGAALSQQLIWQHIFLLAAWFALYLMTYPFFNLFKGRNLPLYRRWTLGYGLASAIFALPALLYNWKMIYFIAAMLPFVAISVYFVKRKDERALLNDLAGILIFLIAGMGAYYFAERAFDAKIWLIPLYQGLFFLGTTLYVKSVLRERKNPRYLWASIGFHWLCPLCFIFAEQYGVALAFVLPAVRAVLLPKMKLSVKEVGLAEMAVSLYFFIIILWATL